MTFIPTRDAQRAKAFYGGMLGLRLVSEDSFAVVFDANGTMLRLTNVPEFKPQSFTVLGWEVSDIDGAVCGPRQKRRQLRKIWFPGPGRTWSLDGTGRCQGRVVQGPRRQRPERDPVSVEILGLEMPPPSPGPWVPPSKKSWPTSSRRRPISSRTTAGKDQVQSCSTWRTHHRFRPSPSPSFILALGLAALRSEEWVAGIPEGLAPVRVKVTAIPVEHCVKIRDFTNWVERKGGSPREVTDRDKVRAA